MELANEGRVQYGARDVTIRMRMRERNVCTRDSVSMCDLWPLLESFLNLSVGLSLSFSPWLALSVCLSLWVCAHEQKAGGGSHVALTS